MPTNPNSRHPSRPLPSFHERLKEVLALRGLTEWEIYEMLTPTRPVMREKGKHGARPVPVIN